MKNEASPVLKRMGREEERVTSFFGRGPRGRNQSKSLPEPQPYSLFLLELRRTLFHMKIREKTISVFFHRELGGLSFQLLLRQNDMWLEEEKKERKVGRRWKEGQFRAPFQARNGHFRENGGIFFLGASAQKKRRSEEVCGNPRERVSRTLGYPILNCACLAKLQIQCVRKRLIEKGKVRRGRPHKCRFVSGGH